MVVDTLSSQPSESFPSSASVCRCHFFTLDFNLSLTSCSLQPSGAYVASNSHWACSDPVWGDVDDLALWSPQILYEAARDGRAGNGVGTVMQCGNDANRAKIAFCDCYRPGQPCVESNHARTATAIMIRVGGPSASPPPPYVPPP